MPLLMHSSMTAKRACPGLSAFETDTRSKDRICTVVERDALLVHFIFPAAIGDDARPGNGETEGVASKLLDEGEILLEEPVIVGRL